MNLPGSIEREKEKDRKVVETNAFKREIESEQLPKYRFVFYSDSVAEWSTGWTTVTQLWVIA